MISFDQILEKRIGTGLYQGVALTTAGMAEFCAGMLFTIMSILLTVLQEEWNLSKAELSSLSSSFLLGVLGGNIVCAFVADKIGRKSTICILTCSTSVLIFYGSVVQSYNIMLFLRLLFGIVYGTLYPLGQILITEVTEAKYRGRFSNAISLIYICGRIYLVSLCYLYLNDYKSGNWRGLLRQNGIPFAITFILFIFLGKETIRYYLNNGQYSVAYDEIQNMIKTNNKPDPHLTEEEKNGLFNWSQKQKQEHEEKQVNQYGVLSREYIQVTLMLWVQQCNVNLQNMSIYLLMPFLFSENNLGFTPMLYLYIAELFITVVMHHLIDNQEYGGRKRIIRYSAIILILANGFMYLLREKFVIFGLILVKFGIRGLSSTIGLVCCESYPLQIRSQGIGIAQAIGKIVTFPSPYLLFALYFIDPYLPFVFMFTLALISFLVDLCCFGKDKTQKPLENLKEEEESDLI